jgi:hypothetical protein
MRELSRKEFLAELISGLVSECREQQEYERALIYVDLALQLNPLSITNIVQKCALNAGLALPLYEKMRLGDTLSSGERTLYERYVSTSEDYESNARSLGWRPDTPEDRATYIQTVQNEKRKRDRQ